MNIFRALREGKGSAYILGDEKRYCYRSRNGFFYWANSDETLVATQYLESDNWLPCVEEEKTKIIKIFDNVKWHKLTLQGADIPYQIIYPEFEIKHTEYTANILLNKPPMAVTCEWYAIQEKNDNDY